MGDPHEYLLNREAARSAAASGWALASSCLRALISRGTHHVVNRMAGDAARDEERQAVCGLLHHALTMADGLDAHLELGASSASIPVLRSLFEAWLQLKFMLSPDDAEIRRQRALAWIVAPAGQQLVELDRFDSNTEQGRQLLARVASEKHARPISMPDPAVVASARRGLKEFLAAPHLAEIHQEFLRTKGNRAISPPWYALFNGPRNLRGVAAVVGLTATFDELYGHYSERGHAKEPLQLFAIKEGRAVLRPLRDAESIPDIGASGVAYLTEALALCCRRASDAEAAAFGLYYAEKIRPTLHELWALQH